MRKASRGGAISRRQMLRSATAAGVALPLAQTFPAGQAYAQGQGQLPEINVTLPVFTVAERDRRWAAVRAIMARPQWNLDAIITAGSDRWGNNARYLTQVALVRYAQPGPQVLFPRDPAKTVHVQISAARHVTEWKDRLGPGGWLADGKMVLKAETGGAALAKLLAEEGFDRPGTRIGVAKLKGTRFEQDGLASATLLDTLGSSLPGVAFVPIEQWGPDAGPIDEVALAKSREEQEVIRRSVAISEQGLAAAIGAVRNGARRQADLWWAAFTTMFAGAGEDIVRVSIGLDEGGNANIGEPVGDPIRMGQITRQEISAAFQGYGCQVNHSFFIGSPSTPGYDYYRAAIEVLLKVHEKAMAFIQPGKTTYGDFQEHNRQSFADLNADGGGLGVHSGGIGQSRVRSGQDQAIIMQPGHSFDFKPSVRLRRERMADVGQQNRAVQLGESLLVTEGGVVRYGSRRMGPIATHT